ncbi:MAG: anti-sigma factor antagonist [Rhodospirillales bacterium]|nr:anti-sigma factor antagonist [Rhodospirillales bacterium]MSP80893.1 anti-sigma factor antagonist [Rhodospirillales bacterium]
MKHQIKENDGALVIALEGDVDLKTSPDARKILLDAVGRNLPIVVDLSGVQYIDSSGVASLIEAFQKARKTGRKFVLAAVSDSALRVLNLARMDKVFAICSNVAEGLAKVR